MGEKGREREEGKGRGLMGMAQKGKRIEGEGIGKGEKREMEEKARGNRREKGSEREENAIKLKNGRVGKGIKLVATFYTPEVFRNTQLNNDSLEDKAIRLHAAGVTGPRV